jgi:iron(III) transport system substrate-binding protein
MVTAFERATGIKVNMTRKSSGENYAQVKAEAANPKGDIWWGGTGDPHLQAAEEGLTLEYKSPKLADLHEWAVRQAEQSKYRTVGVYAGALGFGYNTELLAKKGIPSPSAGRTSWIPNSRTRCRWQTRTPPGPRTRCSRRWSRSWARTRASTT